MDPIDFVTNINGQLNLVWYLNIVLFDEVWWENIWKIKRASWERKNRKAHTWDEKKIIFFLWTKEEIWCTLNGPGVGLAHLSKRDDWVIIRVDHRFGIRHCLVFPWAKNKTKENQKGRRGGEVQTLDGKQSRRVAANGGDTESSASSVMTPTKANGERPYSAVTCRNIRSESKNRIKLGTIILEHVRPTNIHPLKKRAHQMNHWISWHH